MHALWCQQKKGGEKNIEWEKILIIDITNKELVYEILKYNSKQKQSELIEDWGKDMNRKLTEGEPA